MINRFLTIIFFCLIAPTIIIGQSNNSSKIVSIIGVGDIMMGTNYPSKNTLPPDSGKYFFEGVKDIFSKADIVTGNLEGNLSDLPGNPKKCSDSSICYHFRTPEYYAKNLKDAGFDFLSIANNHSNDFGPEVRARTMIALEKYGLSYAGALSCPTSIIEKDGVKYGFAAFSFNSGNCSINDTISAKKIIKELSNQVDIVIVSFHGGGESIAFQHTKNKTEYFAGENRGNVVQFAHLAIDAGADVVFGHGPHVTRALELYKDKLIAYSLGNFCTYKGINIIGQNGIAPIIKVYLTTKGDFVSGEIIPTIQIKHGYPMLDKNKQAIKTIKKLSEIDFPLTHPKITDDGKIIK